MVWYIIVYLKLIDFLELNFVGNLMLLIGIVFIIFLMMFGVFFVLFFFVFNELELFNLLIDLGFGKVFFLLG